MTYLIPRLFTRPLITLSLAAGLALSPASTGPTTAGGNDHGFIVPLIALGLIGVAIASNKNNGVRPPVIPADKQLPHICYKTYQTTNGPMNLFSDTCLRNNFRHWYSLPEQCNISVRFVDRWGRGKWRKRYEPHCLSQHGYQIPAVFGR